MNRIDKKDINAGLIGAGGGLGYSAVFPFGKSRQMGDTMRK